MGGLAQVVGLAPCPQRGVYAFFFFPLLLAQARAAYCPLSEPSSGPAGCLLGLKRIGTAGRTSRAPVCLCEDEHHAMLVALSPDRNPAMAIQAGVPVARA